MGKKRRLLLLGSSVWGEIIKKFAEDYNVELVFAGLYPASLDLIADEFYRIDTTNADIMKSFINEHNIDGIYMGGSEFIISSACGYINELKFPCYCTKAQWECLQNKALFKSLCMNFGLPVVPQYKVKRNNIESSVPADAYPVITKPADGSGSNGFSVCNTPEELLEGYNKAEKDSPTKSVLCEKFVNNQGLVVFYSFTNGEMVYALSEDKFPVKYEEQGSYVAGLFLCESKYIQEFRHKFEEQIRQMFKSINIREGQIWIEIFHDGNDYYFNEVGYRHGGSYSFYSVDYLSRINQMYADLYFALTGESKLYGFNSLVPANVERGKHYCIYPIHINAGTISSFVGIEVVKRWDNVVFFPVSKNVGDTIKDTGSWGQCVALLHFTYDSLDDCKKMIDDLNQTFFVLDENGNNLVNSKLDWSTVLKIYNEN